MICGPGSLSVAHTADESVPFDELVVFSTNLSPRDLMDPAFLRRIPYKLEIGGPTQDEFRRIQSRLRKTVLLVTHDMAEAIALADRIGVLDRGQLIWAGAAHDISDCQDPRVRTFLDAVTVGRGDRGA